MSSRDFCVTIEGAASGRRFREGDVVAGKAIEPQAVAFEAMGKTKVYYNSACPVCDAGIKSQKYKLEASEADIEWVDVHADRGRVEETGAELEFVRERLHLRDEEGRMLVGSAAFLKLWARTPGQGWMARLFGAPIIRQLFDWGYNAFAAVLYRWNRRQGRW